jgi:hypothetical protein
VPLLPSGRQTVRENVLQVRPHAEDTVGIPIDVDNSNKSASDIRVAADRGDSQMPMTAIVVDGMGECAAQR